MAELTKTQIKELAKVAAREANGLFDVEDFRVKVLANSSAVKYELSSKKAKAELGVSLALEQNGSFYAVRRNLRDMVAAIHANPDTGKHPHTEEEE